MNSSTLMKLCNSASPLVACAYLHWGWWLQLGSHPRSTQVNLPVIQDQRQEGFWRTWAKPPMPESLDQSLKLPCRLTYLGLTYLGLFSLTQHRQSTSRTLFLVLDELALHLYLYCSTVCVFSALRFLFIVCWHLAGQRLACTTTPNSSIVLARQWHAGNVSHARWLSWLPARHGRYTPRPRHHSTHPSVSGSRVSFSFFA